MTKHYQQTEFNSIYEELKYELQDVVDFLSYILGKKPAETGVLNLIEDNSTKPANDNWPTRECKSDKIIKVNVK